MNRALRILVTLTVMVCSWLSGFAAAQALEYKTLTTDDGYRFIVIQGEFLPDEQLGGFVDLVTTQEAAFVMFDSPGGSVVSAMALGREIRRLKLATIQPRAADCASACALAFLGGTFRYADAGAIGVHQNWFNADSGIDTGTAVTTVQSLIAMTMAYIKEMDADPDLLQLALSYDSTDMRYLSSSEMRKYRVTNADDEASITRLSSSQSPDVAAPEPAMTAVPQSLLAIPEARTGQIRHPSGAAMLKSRPDEKAADLLQMPNGRLVRIDGKTGQWYRLKTSKGVGYLHEAWVRIDQFENTSPFDSRYIQIKSFRNTATAETYVRSSALNLTAYLAANGWIAITLADPVDIGSGAALLRGLKADGTIPPDSFMTYGNTYVRQVCCR
jgi:hypothetical protein